MNKKIIAVSLVFFLFLTSCFQVQTSEKTSDKYRNYYEIFVRSFCDSNEDGIGDLNGVTNKLHYIANDLGADGIWLMPIMLSPSYHKYDVTDYYSIDSQYGTLDDFDNLIKQAHRLDINVIIDFVINHTSDESLWFTKAVNSLWTGKENKYTDYYNFTTDNNGQGFNQITDKYYYECRFSPDMPDLNLDNTDVRTEILNIAKFWINHGVDGFRLDAVTSYYTGNDTKNIEFMKWLNDSVKEYKSDVYFVGEAWTESSTISEYYTSGIDSFFNFPFSQVNGTIISDLNLQSGESLAKSVKDWNDTIKKSNPNAIDAAFLSNHDNARSAGYLFRKLQKEKMAASLYLMMPGNPFIYYGEEIGMTGSGVDPNKRLPMLWSTTALSGITQPPPGASQTISGIDGVDVQIKDKNSLLNFYKSILKLKKEYPEIARGKMTTLDTQNPQVYASSIKYGESSIYIFHNTGDNALSEDLIKLNLTKIKIKDYLLTGETDSPEIRKSILQLPQYSTIILK